MVAYNVSLRGSALSRRGTPVGDDQDAVRLGADWSEDRIVRKVIRLVDAENAVPAAGFLL